jgi:hypothetical protein
VPNHDTPPKLIEVWLEFHRSDLCQSIDAVFVFNKQGVEIWCLSKDEKNYKKLKQLFEPLQDSYRIEIYATHPSISEDSKEDSAPPPSLSENYELRSYLGDSLAQSRELLDGKDLAKRIAPPDDDLKRQLIVYSEHILTLNSRMKNYAADLPELVQMTLDSELKAELKMRASAVCVDHARKLQVNLSKLTKNLSYAFPKSRPTGPIVEAKSMKKDKLPALEQAEDIANAAKEVAIRVNDFIYPNQHSVALSDLRKPHILDSLKKLEEIVRNFSKELTKIPVDHRAP